MKISEFEFGARRSGTESEQEASESLREEGAGRLRFGERASGREKRRFGGGRVRVRLSGKEETSVRYGPPDSSSSRRTKREKKRSGRRGKLSWVKMIRATQRAFRETDWAG